jgi:hypothetical protein
VVGLKGGWKRSTTVKGGSNIWTVSVLGHSLFSLNMVVNNLFHILPIIFWFAPDTEAMLTLLLGL